MKRLLHLLPCLALFVLANLSLTSCQSDHDSFFTNEKLLTANAASLKETLFTPSLAQPIQPGRNILWCGTFQLAWNEASSLIGEDLHFASEPAVVADLNRKAFTRTDLDDESYVALAGFVRDGIYDAIPKALKDKFHGHASPHYLPSPADAPRPQDIVAYAYLFKNLQFAHPFERLDEGMAFRGRQMQCFGIDPDKPDQSVVRSQVRILDYTGPDDFVIELKSKSNDDRLILAKIPPKPTLEQTIQAVQNRAAKPSTPMDQGDVLKVPKLNFDLTQSFRELLGLPLIVKNPKIAKDLVITAAIQNIRFQMDEKGVRLRSEAGISFAHGAAAPMPRQHIMIFDAPFLIMLQRTAAKTPYFALWVDNAELLTPK
jgi:hypothetical protein